MHAGPSLLANNPNHREEILKLMGGSAGNTFGHVARWLLQPAQSVQATVARTRKAVDAKGQGLPSLSSPPVPEKHLSASFCHACVLTNQLSFVTDSACTLRCVSEIT